MEKSIGATIDIHRSLDVVTPHISGGVAVVSHGTKLDQDDMARMGKNQVFKVWSYLQTLMLFLMLFSVSLVTFQYSHFLWS